MATDDLHNLTGGQVQHVLDHFMYESLRPIILHSNLFDVQLVHLLYIASVNRKRKISALPKDVHLNQLSHTIIEKDREKKFQAIKELRTERKFIFEFINKWLTVTSNYVEMYYKFLTAKQEIDSIVIDTQMKVIEEDLGMERDKLFCAIQQIKDNFDLAIRFRNDIVVNYIKHSYKKANSFVSMKGPTFEAKDVHGNLMIAVIKALDKYDSSSGALTSYIDFWLMNAQTYSNPDHGHEYGIAYTIPQGQREKLAKKKSNEINFSVSLDQMKGQDEDGNKMYELIAGTASVEEEIVREKQTSLIRGLIKKADPKGIVRLYYDVEEVFFATEKRKMVQTMINQLGVDPRKEMVTVKEISSNNQLTAQRQGVDSDANG